MWESGVQRGVTECSGHVSSDCTEISDGTESTKVDEVTLGAGVDTECAQGVSSEAFLN